MPPRQRRTLPSTIPRQPTSPTSYPAVSRTGAAAEQSTGEQQYTCVCGIFGVFQLLVFWVCSRSFFEPSAGFWLLAFSLSDGFPFSDWLPFFRLAIGWSFRLACLSDMLAGPIGLLPRLAVPCLFLTSPLVAFPSLAQLCLSWPSCLSCCCCCRWRRICFCWSMFTISRLRALPPAARQPNVFQKESGCSCRSAPALPVSSNATSYINPAFSCTPAAPPSLTLSSPSSLPSPPLLIFLPAPRASSYILPFLTRGGNREKREG